jgi:hypothetical protein
MRRGPILLAGRIARTVRLVVDEWRWPVVPGAYVTRTGTCSCGDRRCPEPGGHPVDPVSWLAASSDPDRVHGWWLATPLASIVLPVGWHVDLLDVPERGGLAAVARLEMMGYRLPPTIATASGRILLFVAASARRPADLSQGEPAGVPRPETALWLGGDPSGVPDIVVRRGGTVVLPPLGPEPPGVTRWVEPLRPGRRSLPRVEDVLGPVLHACREVVVRRSRRSGRLASAVAARTAALTGSTVPVPKTAVTNRGDSAGESVLSARHAPGAGSPAGGAAAPPGGTACSGAASAGSPETAAGTCTVAAESSTAPAVGGGDHHAGPVRPAAADPAGATQVTSGPTALATTAQPGALPAASSSRRVRPAGAGTSGYRAGRSYSAGRARRPVPLSPRVRGAAPTVAAFGVGDARATADRSVRLARRATTACAAGGRGRPADTGPPAPPAAN